MGHKSVATDISSHVIETAKAGRYERERVELLPRLWQRSYFNLSDGNQLEITPALKQEVIFRTFNLMGKPNFRSNENFIRFFAGM